MNNQNDNSSFYFSDRQNIQIEKFVELLTANYHRIYAFILGLVPNDADADDIMQETCIVIWKKFCDFQAGTNFTSWAVTIAKYCVLSYRKKCKTKTSVTQLCANTIELLAAEQDPITDQSEERLEALNSCIKKLAQSDREFVQLRYRKNLSINDIARQFGQSTQKTYRKTTRIHHLLLGCIRRQLIDRGAV